METPESPKLAKPWGAHGSTAGLSQTCSSRRGRFALAVSVDKMSTFHITYLIHKTS